MFWLNMIEIALSKAISDWDLSYFVWGLCYVSLDVLIVREGLLILLVNKPSSSENYKAYLVDRWSGANFTDSSSIME